MKHLSAILALLMCLALVLLFASCTVDHRVRTSDAFKLTITDEQYERAVVSLPPSMYIVEHNLRTYKRAVIEGNDR